MSQTMDQCYNTVEVTMIGGNGNSIRDGYDSPLQPIHLNCVKSGILRRIRSKSNLHDKGNIRSNLQDVTSPLSTYVTILSSDSDEQSFKENTSQVAVNTGHKCMGSNSRSSSSQGIPDNEKKFFNMDDFEPSTWLELDSKQNISNVGFAAVMAATVMVHPLVFVTGAATAVWAVASFHAVEKGYEYYSDGSFSRLFWEDSSQSPVIDNGLKDENDGITAQIQRIKEGITNGEEGDRATLESNDVVGMESEIDDDIPTKKSRPLVLLPRSSARGTQDIFTLNENMKKQFPTLQNHFLELEFPGLNAIEFFEVFFSDNAPYSYKDFQETRGDVDVEFGKWKCCDESDINPLSFHPHAMRKEQLIPFPDCIHEERTLNFKSLTKSFFGPTYATARKLQRVTKLSTKCVIIENKTELFNIPFSDRFFVVERWIAETKENVLNTLPNVTKLNVEVGVFMLKPCTWENQIRSKSLAALKESLSSWGAKATQALEITVKKKLEQINKNATSKAGVLSTTVCRKPTVSCHCEPEAFIEPHRAELSKLEQHTKSGDSECITIERSHSLSHVRWSAFPKVFERNKLSFHEKTLKKTLDTTSTKTNNTEKKRIFRILKRRNKSKI